MTAEELDLWWAIKAREGFSDVCRTKFHNDFLPVPMDDVSPGEAQAYQRRSDLLATIVGLQQGKSNGAVRRAIELR